MQAGRSSFSATPFFLTESLPVRPDPAGLLFLPPLHSRVVPIELALQFLSRESWGEQAAGGPGRRDGQQLQPVLDPAGVLDQVAESLAHVHLIDAWLLDVAADREEPPAPARRIRRRQEHGRDPGKRL